MFQCSIAVAAWICAWTALAQVPQVVCLRAEGSEVRGALLGLRNGVLELSVPGGKRSLPLADLQEVVLGERLAPVLRPAFLVATRAGGRLMVHRIGAGDEPGTVGLVGYGWQGEGVPIDALALLVVRPQRPFPESSPQLGGLDRLRLRTEEGPGEVEAAVASIGDRGVYVRAGGAAALIAWDRIESITFAGRPAGRRFHRIFLWDGSVLAGDRLQVLGDTLLAFCEAAQFSVPLERVVRIEPASDRFVYLSDLEPLEVSVEPGLGVRWPPARDRSLAGEPLRLGGRLFRKGLSVKPRTAVTFAVPEGFTTFLATVGIDDSCPRGRVVFRVLADGEELLEVGPVAAGEPPRRARVGLPEAGRLTLVVDRAEGGPPDGNLADWAGARLLR